MNLVGIYSRSGAVNSIALKVLHRPVAGEISDLRGGVGVISGLKRRAIGGLYNLSGMSEMTRWGLLSWYGHRPKMTNEAPPHLMHAHRILQTSSLSPRTIRVCCTR